MAKERYGECFSDIHHLAFPRNFYRSRVEQEYRELPENKVQLCRAEHDDIHGRGDIPVKPSVDVMRHAIEQTKRAEAECLGSLAVERSND